MIVLIIVKLKLLNSFISLMVRSFDGDPLANRRAVRYGNRAIRAMPKRMKTLLLCSNKKNKKGIWVEHFLWRYNGRKPYRLLAQRLKNRVEKYRFQKTYVKYVSSAEACPQDVFWKWSFPHLTCRTDQELAQQVTELFQRVVPIKTRSFRQWLPDRSLPMLTPQPQD